MKISPTIIPFTTLILAIGCASHPRGQEGGLKQRTEFTSALTQEKLGKLIQDWPETAEAAASSMINLYGLPDEASPASLTWKKERPFERITAHREGVLHNFPYPHTDVLLHTVKYEVPLNKVDEILSFNGSVTFDRTRGELSAHCDQQGVNILALNLAHDIARGEKLEDEARVRMGQEAQELAAGNPSNMTTTVLFNPSEKAAYADVIFKDFQGMRGQLEAEEERREAMEAQGSLESDGP